MLITKNIDRFYFCIIYSYLNKTLNRLYNQLVLIAVTYLVIDLIEMMQTLINDALRERDTTSLYF